MRWMLAIAIVACPLPAAPADAQTVSSVPGPDVSASDRTLEYRIGLAQGEDGGAVVAAHRLHYEHGLSDQLRLRATVCGSDTETGDFELVHVQGKSTGSSSSARRRAIRVACASKAGGSKVMMARAG